MIQWLWNVLTAPTCVGCGKPVNRDGDWCTPCFTKAYAPHYIKSNEPYISRVLAATYYEGGIRTMMHDVKFHSRKERARGAAPFLHRLIMDDTYRDFWHFDYLIPVPTSEKKKADRGYNQVDLFFKDWSNDVFGPRWLDCLHKIDHTEAMWHLTKRERFQNLKGAFYGNDAYKSLIRHKNILLVDDIYTTGATVGEISKVLHQFQVKDIRVLTLAGSV